MIGFIIVKQFLKGDWVELIRLEVEEKDLDETMKTMKDLIFDSDKVTVYNDKSVVIFNRLDGPVKLDYIVKPEPPSGVDMPT